MIICNFNLLRYRIMKHLQRMPPVYIRIDLVNILFIINTRNLYEIDVTLMYYYIINTTSIVY
jgi:hypothetical protein